MIVDPFHLSVALLPLAIYLLAMGLIHLAQRPLLTTGARDLAALGVALTGLVLVGPMELFVPEEAALRFGVYTWLLLLAFYGLCVSLIVLISRPRLIVYNIGIERLRPLLANVVARIDPAARWAGDSLVLSVGQRSDEENAGHPVAVQLHIEATPGTRHVALVSNGPVQNFQGWRILELGLASELRQVRVPMNPLGWGLVSSSALLLVTCLAYMLTSPQAVAQGFRDMLMW